MEAFPVIQFNVVETHQVNRTGAGVVSRHLRTGAADRDDCCAAGDWRVVAGCSLGPAVFCHGSDLSN